MLQPNNGWSSDVTDLDWIQLCRLSVCLHLHFAGNSHKRDKTNRSRERCGLLLRSKYSSKYSFKGQRQPVPSSDVYAAHANEIQNISVGFFEWILRDASDAASLVTNLKSTRNAVAYLYFRGAVQVWHQTIIQTPYGV